MLQSVLRCGGIVEMAGGNGASPISDQLNEGRSLRQRLQDDAREPQYIKTVRSEGYVFAATVAVDEMAK